MLAFLYLKCSPNNIKSYGQLLLQSNPNLNEEEKKTSKPMIKFSLLIESFICTYLLFTVSVTIYDNSQRG